MGSTSDHQIPVPNSENDENGDVADMDMCTSPTSSKSASPTLPIGGSDALPNVGLPPNSTQPTSWILAPDAIPSTSFGDPSTAMYMMLSHLNQQYGYGSAIASDRCSTSIFQCPIQKEPMRLTNAVLYPPNPNAPLPQLRERPPGCRTIFVGGLPEKCTEDILRELMERCGEIQSIRMSKKNFAHVRFVNHDSVDRGLYFSGYRMKVDDRSDKEYTGRLHVDYAQARDDMHEWEKEKRRDRSDSPSDSSEFNENEATGLLEKLKDTDTFTEASRLLLNWLDKGACSKKASAVFYGMIAAVNTHVRRLLHDRRQYEDELREFREKYARRMQDLMAQFHQVEKIFRLARKQKNWDHFSRAQRKNVDAWLKHAEAIRKANEEAMIRDRHEEEMETSDDDDEEFVSPSKKLKADTGCTRESRMADLVEENARLKAELGELKAKGSVDDDHASGTIASASEDIGREAAKSIVPNHASIASESESRNVALLACFLNVHPFGATIDYMWSYLRQLMPSIRVVDVETVLEKYPHLFRLQTSGIGATYERRWIFEGYQITTKDKI